MKQRRIHWTVRALQRLDEIGAYIEHEDPDAAARAVARIVASLICWQSYQPLVVSVA